MKLSDIGERRIIDLISRDREPDDCAVLNMGSFDLLLSTDVITRKTHIPEGASPEMAGSFFAAINLSDIAADAGIPVGFLVSLSISPDYDMEYLKRFYSGIYSKLSEFNIGIIGGDTKEGDDFTASGTIIGRQKPSLIRRRSDIAVNHYVLVTNSLGRSGAGYLFYKNSYKTEYGIKKMLEIHPRIMEAQILSMAGARFMMDLSDGIYSSIYQMKHDYNIGFKIDYNKIKKDPDVSRAAQISGVSESDIVMSFGGDYELFFTVEKNNYDSFKNRINKYKIDAYIIGETYDGPNMVYYDSWVNVNERGYEHFLKDPLDKK
ncbi:MULTISPECIES: thiamine-phosphate kinase [Acidiplasma]|uniref:Thiamine-monophosphate kinase n=3 Tax=Acidiplasma TaxID=507753 RepID=A0A0N8VLG4_9ARCH|nr:MULTISPECIES: thiamine-phosphate kinase [Acidiplasma]KJE49371.1 thiamine monophosphate kinase [Acidiplasma sp. MBA-1]KQB36184.1 thiamine monophosphate kinase [Acidiplasma aeolicum]KQB36452.1 thiamine monophosphate kinase [Acidiplasma cupricumulans]WMT54687.1 MAG: thiamine-phosphate kinase [Acidiplasma sp.]